jgi:hypothetical protein
MLSEQRRQQLDGIVSQMLQNQESDENVQFVVNDFKQKYANEATQQPSVVDLDKKSAEQNLSLFPSTTGEGGASAGLKSLGNVPSSAINLGKSIYDVVRHPIQTLKGIGNVALGTAQQLIPGEQSKEVYFDAAKDYVKERYGSLESLQRTATNDPLGFGTDVLTLITGGAGLLNKASKAAGAAKAVEMTGKLSSVDKVAELTKIRPISEGLNRLLQKSSFNLNATQKQNFARNLSETSDWLTSNKVVGPALAREKMVGRIMDKYENAMEKALTDEVVSRDNLISKIDDLKGNPDFVDSLERSSYFSQIDRAVDVLKTYPEQIPAQTVNRLKRATFKNAYNKKGTDVLSDVDFAIADTIYDELADSLLRSGVRINGKDLRSFNMDYKSAITARKILQITANKNPSVIARALSVALGYVAGQGWGALGGLALAQPGGNLISGTLNTLKSGAAAASGLKAPRGTLKAVEAARQTSGLDEYLKSLGL